MYRNGWDLKTIAKTVHVRYSNLKSKYLIGLTKQDEMERKANQRLRREIATQKAKEIKKYYKEKGKYISLRKAKSMYIRDIKRLVVESKYYTAGKTVEEIDQVIKTLYKIFGAEYLQTDPSLKAYLKYLKERKKELLRKAERERKVERRLRK
jgi:hypothetical protein